MGVNPMEFVTTATTTLVGVMNSVITAATGNPVLSIFVASGIIGIGVGLFKSLRH
jgi:hypothetical protein